MLEVLVLIKYLRKTFKITVGVSGCQEMTITAPTTPNQIIDALFGSYPENEPQAAVLQQELIIACSDLVRSIPFFK